MTTPKTERWAKDVSWKTSIKSDSKRKEIFRACKYFMLDPNELLYLYETVINVGGGNIANLGCFKGGSATSMALALRDSKLNGRVYTVDKYGSVPVKGTNAPKGSAPWAREKWRRVGVEEFIQQNIDCTYEFAEKVSDLKFRFVFVDADHSREGALKDILAWSPLVEEGGLLSIHDAHFDSLYPLLDELVDKYLGEGWIEDVPCVSIRAFKRVGPSG